MYVSSDKPFCVQTIFGKVCVVITISGLDAFDIIYFAGCVSIYQQHQFN